MEDMKINNEVDMTTLNWVPDNIIVISNKDYEEVFRFTADGELIFGDGYKERTDEAAKVFWDSFQLQGSYWLDEQRQRILDEELAKCHEKTLQE